MGHSISAGESPAVDVPSTGPSEDQCWSEFWTAIASIWATLPPEIQQEYAAKYPPGSSKARQDLANGDSAQDQRVA